MLLFELKLRTEVRTPHLLLVGLFMAYLLLLCLCWCLLPCVVDHKTTSLKYGAPPRSSSIQELNEEGRDRHVLWFPCALYGLLRLCHDLRVGRWCIFLEPYFALVVWLTYICPTNRANSMQLGLRFRCLAACFTCCHVPPPIFPCTVIPSLI